MFNRRELPNQEKKKASYLDLPLSSMFLFSVSLLRLSDEEKLYQWAEFFTGSLDSLLSAYGLRD